jgi:iron-sulfur cluster assembly protein
MKITVTNRAVEQLQGSGINRVQFLRLGVQQGGCAGTSYAAFADDSLTSHDAIIYDQQDVRIVTDSEFLPLIDGLNIDFSDDLIQPGFVLKNPNAKRSCGCGSSFKANEEAEITPCGGQCA